MVYLLDTDALIFLIRGLKAEPSSAGHKRAHHLLKSIKAALSTGAAVGISALTRAELEYGAAKSQDPAKEPAALEKVLAPFDEFAFDAAACARQYGSIRAALEHKGESLAAMDLLIAAHALALGATLVSNNTRHFKRVKGLVVENWTTT